jgi:gluconate 5-dehydrogenase
MDLFDLSNKTILLTGGAGYLGESMSEALVAYGANVIIASRDERKCDNLADKLRRRYGTKTMGMLLDISSMESIRKVVNQIHKEYKTIDVLVNNATFSVSGYFEDLNEDAWGKAIDGTLNSVFRMCHEIIPYMKKNKKGNIINIASMYGQVSPNPDLYKGEVRLNNPAPYGAGKAAVIQLTKYLAGYYGKYGIRCNSLSPGPFPSPAVQQTSWFIDNLANNTMLKRIGNPVDLAGVIVLLASDASAYITGTNINVDGGWTAW